MKMVAIYLVAISYLCALFRFLQGVLFGAVCYEYAETSTHSQWEPGRELTFSSIPSIY